MRLTRTRGCLLRDRQRPLIPPYHDGDLTRMRAFRDWCLSALRASGDFDGVDLFDVPNSLAANDAIIAPNPRTPTAAVWTCLASDHPDHGFLPTVNRLFATVRAQPSLRHCRFVLVSPDDLGGDREPRMTVLRRND